MLALAAKARDTGGKGKGTVGVPGPSLCEFNQGTQTYGSWRTGCGLQEAGSSPPLLEAAGSRGIRGQQGLGPGARLGSGEPLPHCTPALSLLFIWKGGLPTPLQAPGTSSDPSPAVVPCVLRLCGTLPCHMLTAPIRKRNILSLFFFLVFKSSLI